MPVTRHIKEKREIYQLSAMYMTKAEPTLKENIINDIIQLPSSVSSEEDSHTPGADSINPQSEALYQSVLLYKKLFNDNDSITKIKSVIKSTQKDKNVSSMLLDLI